MAAIPSLPAGYSGVDAVNWLINQLNSAPGGADGPVGPGNFTTVAASGAITGQAGVSGTSLTASNTSGQGTLTINSQQASGFGGFMKFQSGGGNVGYMGVDAGINGGTDYADLTIQTVSGNLNLQPTGGAVVIASPTLLATSVSLTNGAASATGTLTNAPTAGNPTKWVPIHDNGTTRYIPCW